ncbi:MAG TPA: enolase C-terminal domain-like protein [Patescibacteria group bacterium]
MAKIKHIAAREVLNGKGDPSVEVTVVLNDNSIGVATSSNGTSVGSYEAFNLYDHDDARFKGMGMLKAIQTIDEIVTPKLVGLEATKQQLIDRTMIDLDGTQNKGRIGANTMLAVSMAVAKAAAASSVLPPYLYLREFLSNSNISAKIPAPIFTLINGGSYGAESVDFQDFLLMPASSSTYDQSLEMGVRAFNAVGDTLKMSNLYTLTTIAGGYGPALTNNIEVLNVIAKALEATTMRLGFDVFLGINANATFFYKGQQYRVKDKDTGQSAKSMTQFYQELIKNYHILYLEDPLAEDDWDGWTNLTATLAQDALIVGSDLTATNPYRLQMAIDKRAVSAITIKPNQIGTVIESLAVVEVAKAAGLRIVVSDRSSETNEDFIADFAVAVGADYVRLGGPSRGEHVAKYNRLSQINSQLTLLQK